MDESKPTVGSRLGIESKDGQLNISKQSVLTAVGGWLGIIESMLPTLIFVSVLSVTKQALISVIAAGSVSAIFMVIKLIQRRPVTQAFAGAVGVGISAFLTLREGGQPADYFISGFFTNGIYLGVILVSLLIRWPIVGVLIGLLMGDVKGWRKDKVKLRRFQAATLLWVGLFAARLIVQLPLYFSNQIELLGILRVVMGVPLYALCIWFNWLLVRGIINARR